ncbi:hypothetical protein BHM03_00032956 [Ensete ventricosum]|nr:hypothetical protein BHM03_00032956 [Ensete ventricosum]
MSGTYRSVRLPIRGPPTTGQFRQKSTRPREETKRLPVRGERSRRRFAISTCTTRYGRYITVYQVTGMRTTHYRAVSPKIDRQRSIEGEIDHRRSIEEEKGKKKRKRRKKKRRKNTVPSSPARHRCPRVARAPSLSSGAFCVPYQYRQYVGTLVRTGKGNANDVVLATPLERIESGDETPSQSHSATHLVQRHDTNVDSSSSTDNGGYVEQSYVSST